MVTMNKFHIKSVLAFLSLAAVTGLAFAMLNAPELSNKTEIGILLGVLASACGTAYKYLFEDTDKHKRDEE